MHPSTTKVISMLLLYPVVSGCILLHLVGFGCIRLYPDVSCCIWLYPDISRCIRVYSGLSGCIRVYPGVSGFIRMYPGVSGCIRDPGVHNLYPTWTVEVLVAMLARGSRPAVVVQSFNASEKCFLVVCTLVLLAS